MKLGHLFCLISMLSVPNCFALKPASTDEFSAIEDQIRIANRMDKKIAAAQSKLDDSNAPRESVEYLRLQRDVVREKHKQYAAYTKAIHMTIIAYDLEPRSRRGTSVMPWTKGREVVWLPVAGEDPTRELEDSRGNRKETSRTPLDWAGRTFTDGVTYINPETLRMGPDFLASTLLHERTHFEQNTTRGRGDKLSTAEAEVEAYQTELNNLDNFFDASNPKRNWARTHIETLQAQKQSKVNEQRAAKKGLQGLINRIRRPTPNPDFNDSTLHTDAELEALKKQSDKFDAEARMNALQLAERARAHADIARRDHDERLKNVYAELARRSCANPGSVSQAELNALPEPYDAGAMALLPQGLGECGETLYNLLQFGATAEALRAAASAVSSGGAQPVREPVLAGHDAGIMFSGTFARIRDLAVTACTAPERAIVDESLVRPNRPYDFTDRDSQIAASFAAELGDCPKRLFNKLIEMIRTGQGSSIDNRWVHDMAAAYSAPAYVPPPNRGGGDPCRDNGNVRCP